MDAKSIQVKVGSGPKSVRIVHISDTHQKENVFLKNIPFGDILVHSGDFSHFWKKMTEDNYEQLLKAFNEFLGKLPHKHKIFVSGNHETRLPFHSKEDIQALLSNCVYLQDSAVVIEGIKFYGSPWTHTKHGFIGSAAHIKSMWERIPVDTDVLITHHPPYNILDSAYLMHWGCRDLRDRVLKIRPKIHLFGHVHDDAGVQVIENVLFSNAAMHGKGKPVVIDFHYISPSEQKQQAATSSETTAAEKSKILTKSASPLCSDSIQPSSQPEPAISS